MRGCQDTLHLCHHVDRGRGQVGLDDFRQLGESVGVPGRTAAFRDQFVYGAGDAVIEQFGDGAIWMMAERQFSLICQLCVDGANR